MTLLQKAQRITLDLNGSRVIFWIDLYLIMVNQHKGLQNLEGEFIGVADNNLLDKNMDSPLFS
ncbi:hypothetical protein C4A77_06440 [Brevibacillus laterosporus]|uniref:Uncharacterized protein n=1 Tax=Brevibacillus laterosporus TaxID=1465 RepID=A0AAP8U6A3_BRELA|nr:hypothetical protein C4A77_06440 [Brevibacillus laterosporus]